MGTRSRIALEYADEMILSIYCHWDGYILGNGKTLQENYKTREKVQQLMELGDLSSLGEAIGHQHDFDWRTTYWEEAKKRGMTRREQDKFIDDAPFAKMCCSYRRDRGETDTEAMSSLSRKELVDWFNDSDHEYLYLFTKNDYWLVYSVDNKSWHPLLVRLLAEEAKEAA